MEVSSLLYEYTENSLNGGSLSTIKKTKRSHYLFLLSTMFHNIRNIRIKSILYVGFTIILDSDQLPNIP